MPWLIQGCSIWRLLLTLKCNGCHTGNRGKRSSGQEEPCHAKESSQLLLSFLSISRGQFIKDFEVDDNFVVDVGVKLDDLALPEEVQLIFTHRKRS